MRSDTDQHSQPSSVSPALPRNSGEFVNLFAHFYRAEMGLTQSWRDRIDRTTNWAITAVAAMLSFSFSSPSTHHSILVFAMVLTTLLLVIESRRYRFFDVYRNRGRRLQRNYYAAVFAPDLGLDPTWSQTLAEELRNPVFFLTLSQALSRRLSRNYIWIFLVLLFAWLLKTSAVQPYAGQPAFVHSVKEWLTNADIGPIPGSVVTLAITLFYVYLLYATFKNQHREGEQAYGNVHV
jgi:uncharacterized membrane protein